MPDFKSTDVDSKQIENTAANIDRDIQELCSISSVIKDGVMVNLDPYWQGQAKESFEQQLAQFSLNLISLVDGYKELNEQLKKAGNTYSKADDSVRQLIAQLPR